MQEAQVTKGQTPEGPSLRIKEWNSLESRPMTLKQIVASNAC